MTTQASITIKFHDDPRYCQNSEKSESCNFLIMGFCVLRTVDPEKEYLDRFLKLKNSGERYLKDSNCKFIWQQSKQRING